MVARWCVTNMFYYHNSSIVPYCPPVAVLQAGLTMCVYPDQILEASSGMS